MAEVVDEYLERERHLSQAEAQRSIVSKRVNIFVLPKENQIATK